MENHVLDATGKKCNYTCPKGQTIDSNNNCV